MIKIFTTNKNGKIELDAKELKELLDEAYWDGYRANNLTITYSSPSIATPYVYYNTATSGTITLSSEMASKEN